MTKRVVCQFALPVLVIALTLSLYSQDGERLAALAANDIYPTFSLKLTAKSPEYRVGSIIWITIVQTNLTDHDIDCSYTDHFEAIDEDGKQIKEHSWVPEQWAHGCSVGKGEQYPHMQQLERVFKFDRPGKYAIRVSRREPFLKDENGEPLVVWSSPITITIIG